MLSIRPAAQPFVILLVLAALLPAACDDTSPSVDKRIVDGDPEAGAALIRDYGCPSCHAIPGIRGANGIVGPPLDRFARRGYVAGTHPNTPDNLVLWIMDPPRLAPLTAMPDMNVTEEHARHIAAYLYTLR